MDKHMAADLVCDALKMALYRHRIKGGLIAHSDRASNMQVVIIKRYCMTRALYAVRVVRENVMTMRPCKASSIS